MAEEEGIPNDNSLWPVVFPDTNGIFHEFTVKEYLFEGYRFCNVTDMPPPPTPTPSTIFCNAIKDHIGDSKTMTVDEEGAIVFSFFNHVSEFFDKIKLQFLE